MSAFVHLRLHTEYSITDSIVRIDEAVARAASDGIPALAITDQSNLFGAVKFYQAARGRGVQPIIGCDVWVSNDKNRDQPSRLLLLCRSRSGYLNLCRLLTRAYRENLWRGRAEMKREWLVHDAVDGLIALSGAATGDVGQALAQGDAERAGLLAKAWALDFPDAYYLEIQRVDRARDDALVAATLSLAEQANLPVVATHPIQFMQREDFKAHEARVCISRGEVLGDPRRSRDFTEEHYFKSAQDMRDLFADVPEAIENALEIARRCHFEFALGKSKLPVFPTPEGVSIEAYFYEQAKAGLERRLESLYRDAARRDEVRPRYQERLDYEVKTIVHMGFPGYFLIVADFINWAKNNGVPVGPGRGSGAGSLVAYSLGITGLDPLQYDLIFERFLNPDRVSMPDFDIDFCQDGRDRVIDYVKKKYGAESVSQIATFGTMAAKAVIRDVGRVLGMSYGHVDGIAKLVPNQLGITLTEAFKSEPQFNDRRKAEEEVDELLTLAVKLEGITRNVGMHAGGVLIAPGPLTEFTPLYVAEGSDSVISQYDKDDVEQVGLVKFDFLGLTTLTILEEAERNVRELGEKEFDLAGVPLDDPKSFQIFTKGNTAAIFQFESKGMRDMLIRAKPDRLEDLIALNALYRPGPMDSIPDYCDRKAGKSRVQYVDPKLEPVLSPILGPTYGVMVYQEQVMQIAREIGGYSLGGADLLRRAMGKKKPEEMARHRATFANGAAKNHVSNAAAMALYDAMEKFAGYGFNKSHSAPYAYLGYLTAYLKANHAAAFMAANLSCVMDFTDKVEQLVEDAKANGLVVSAPDINRGAYRFVAMDRTTLQYGLGAVKGTGRGAIENIVAARAAGGPFKDLLDFVKRVDRHVVNKRAMEAFIKAGAFDALEPNRHALLLSLPSALELADKADRDKQQVSLFGDAGADSGAELALANVTPWGERDKLMHEKQALGFYFSGHPFTSYEKEVRQIVKTALKDIAPNTMVLLAGILHESRVKNGKRGKMCVLSLDDATARIEVLLYAEVFDKRRGLLQEDSLVIVRGKVTHDDFSGGNRVAAEDVFDLDTARRMFAKRIELRMNGQADGTQLKRLLEPHLARGEVGCPVWIFGNNGTAEYEAHLPDAWKVRPAGELMDGLRLWLGENNANVVYDLTGAQATLTPRNWGGQRGQYASNGADDY
ncbi:MAG: DNA polymerase III subunit alpha [Betaproteobacteria bacterium]|nr:DNA polymerase III subunit alpha [Betaproteobacteria bacterium]